MIRHIFSDDSLRIAFAGFITDGKKETIDRLLAEALLWKIKQSSK